MAHLGAYRAVGEQPHRTLQVVLLIEQVARPRLVPEGMFTVSHILFTVVVPEGMFTVSHILFTVVPEGLVCPFLRDGLDQGRVLRAVVRDVRRPYSHAKRLLGLGPHLSK